jgi:hypothetical protein
MRRANFADGAPECGDVGTIGKYGQPAQRVATVERDCGEQRGMILHNCSTFE